MKMNPVQLALAILSVGLLALFVWALTPGDDKSAKKAAAPPQAPQPAQASDAPAPQETPPDAAAADGLLPAPSESAKQAPPAEAPDPNLQEAQAQGLAEIAHFQKLVDEKPNDASARYELASALYRNGNSLLAAQQYEMAVKLNPEDVESWTFLGLARLNIGQFAEGEEALEIALSKRPEDPTIRRFHCEAYIKLGRLADADKCLKETIKAFPKDCRPLLQSARLSSKAGGYQGGVEAERAIKKATELCPNELEPWDELGRFYFASSKFQESINAYCEAFERQPNPVYRQHQLDAFRDLSKIVPFRVPCLKPGEEEGFDLSRLIR